MDGLRNFIEVGNHDAVDVGGLRPGTKSIRVKKSQFSDAYPDAVFREGADELTLLAEEVGLLRTFIDTKHLEFERWGRRGLVRPFKKGVEGKEREALYYHNKE